MHHIHCSGYGVHRQCHAWFWDFAVSTSNYHHSHFASYHDSHFTSCQFVLDNWPAKRCRYFETIAMNPDINMLRMQAFRLGLLSPFKSVCFSFSSTQEQVVWQSLVDLRARNYRCYHHCQRTLGWMYLLFFGKAPFIRRFYLACSTGAKHSALSTFNIGHAFRLHYMHIQGAQYPLCNGLRRYHLKM